MSAALRQVMIRYGSYPVVMLPAAVAAAAVASSALPAWPALALIASVGVTTVALLERLSHYEPEWQGDHGDLNADVVHGVVNFGLLALAGVLLHALRQFLPIDGGWPHQWPGAMQLLLAGLIVDAGLYTMHRLIHRYASTGSTASGVIR